MNQLLFDILPIDFILDRSKIFLNKNYQYVLGELKNYETTISFRQNILELEAMSLCNEIEDKPLNWYFLDVLRSLQIFQPDVTKVNLINNLFDEVKSSGSLDQISNYQYESNGFTYNIPLNLIDSLGLKYGNYNIFNNIEKYQNWESNFIKATEIIRSVNLQILYDINPLVKNILVIESKNNSHGSMSPKSLIGSIFLPDVHDSTLIAECMIHECLHQYLYRLEHVSSIFENSLGNEELYYSPWKDEPRPLNMVLHGAFVFTGVIMFYNELCKKDLPNKYIINFKERIVYRYMQVNIALNVLTHNNKFSKFGNDILQILRSYNDEIRNSEFYDTSLDVDTVLDHFSAFSNKDFTHVSI